MTLTEIDINATSSCYTHADPIPRAIPPHRCSRALPWNASEPHQQRRASIWCFIYVLRFLLLLFLLLARLIFAAIKLRSHRWHMLSCSRAYPYPALKATKPSASMSLLLLRRPPRATTQCRMWHVAYAACNNMCHNVALHAFSRF